MLFGECIIQFTLSLSVCKHTTSQHSHRHTERNRLASSITLLLYTKSKVCWFAFFGLGQLL